MLGDFARFLPMSQVGERIMYFMVESKADTWQKVTRPSLGITFLRNKHERD